MSSLPIYSKTRVVLELTSPCCISAGDDTLESDQPFVCDANGLPTLPGTSIAGMLRAAFAREVGEEAASHWFGNTSNHHENGRASRVRVTWGKLHDQRDRPIDRRLEADEWDEFSSRLGLGEVRDRVRISHLGVAEDTGKFDHQLVHTGCRFSFDLDIIGDANEEGEVKRVRDTLLSALARPDTRLGGAVHSGFGAFAVTASGEIYDLSDKDDFVAFCKLSASLEEPLPLSPLRIAESSSGLKKIELSLTPRDFFVVGGGEPMLSRVVLEEQRDDAPDIVPMRTFRIDWLPGQGMFSEPYVLLPATSIKGALAHRVAFHANRLSGRFLTDEGDLTELAAHTGEGNEVVRELFGFCKGGSGDDGDLVQAGRVLFEEVILEDARTTELTHTSIDPFTAGVRDRMLFDEEVVWREGKSKRPLEVRIKIAIEDPETLSETARRALDAAIKDLIAGRLSLGGGWGRGHGFFHGEVCS